MSKVTEMLVPPDTWFTQEVIAKGNHIVILVNGKKVVDFVDTKNTYTKGHFAIQQHPPAGGTKESIIMIKKAEVKELPAGKKVEKKRKLPDCWNRKSKRSWESSQTNTRWHRTRRRGKMYYYLALKELEAQLEKHNVRRNTCFNALTKEQQEKMLGLRSRKNWTRLCFA